jgi:hypothetical protein
MSVTLACRVLSGLDAHWRHVIYDEARALRTVAQVLQSETVQLTATVPRTLPADDMSAGPGVHPGVAIGAELRAQFGGRAVFVTRVSLAAAENALPVALSVRSGLLAAAQWDLSPAAVGAMGRARAAATAAVLTTLPPADAPPISAATIFALTPRQHGGLRVMGGLMRDGDSTMSRLLHGVWLLPEPASAPQKANADDDSDVFTTAPRYLRVEDLTNASEVARERPWALVDARHFLVGETRAAQRAAQVARMQHVAAYDKAAADSKAAESNGADESTSATDDDAPASADDDVPASADDDVPASADDDVPASADDDAPALNAEADAPETDPVDVFVQTHCPEEAVVPIEVDVHQTTGAARIGGTQDAATSKGMPHFVLVPTGHLVAICRRVIDNLLPTLVRNTTLDDEVSLFFVPEGGTHSDTPGWRALLDALPTDDATDDATHDATAARVQLDIEVLTCDVHALADALPSDGMAPAAAQ